MADHHKVPAHHDHIGPAVGSVHWSRRQQGYEQAKAPFIPRTLGVTVGLLAAGGVSTTEEY